MLLSLQIVVAQFGLEFGYGINVLAVLAVARGAQVVAVVVKDVDFGLNGVAFGE